MINMLRVLVLNRRQYACGFAGLNRESLAARNAKDFFFRWSALMGLINRHRRTNKGAQSLFK
ncbi:hypothetical protein [Variovorax sp. Root318D1]|uniref:hypothetical protein n=1 Tax=Variovorax sp. Root318D1 TaxID=1736513 RepID=UPI0012FB79BA|nr:hypothetical protein [Variovorax sp. Root318D1]